MCVLVARHLKHTKSLNAFVSFGDKIGFWISMKRILKSDNFRHPIEDFRRHSVNIWFIWNIFSNNQIDTTIQMTSSEYCWILLVWNHPFFFHSSLVLLIFILCTQTEVIIHAFCFFIPLKSKLGYSKNDES